MFTYKISKPSKQPKGNAITSNRKLRARKRKGAVTVEVCFIFPFLVWITFSIVQYGWIMWKEIQLTNLSRDAMRYLSCSGVDTSNAGISSLYANSTTTSPKPSVRWYVAQQAQNTGLAANDITVTIANYGQTATRTVIPQGATTGLPGPGDRVEVQLQYTMTTTNTIFLNGLVPWVGQFLNVPQSRTTQMIMEYNLG